MKLSKRERNIVLFATIFLVIFLITQFLIFPFIDYKKQMFSMVQKKQKNILELLDLAKEYNKYMSNVENLEKITARRDKNFSLFTFLENVSGKTELKGNVKYMKPSEMKPMGSFKENMVEMELDNITYEQLLKFMYEVEYSDMGISLKRVSIKKKQAQKGLLDVILQVVTYERVG